MEHATLATLGMWQTFGERALLKNERRYATVRVTSDELHVMSITRSMCEAALSLKLGDILKYEDKARDSLYVSWSEVYGWGPGGLRV